MEELKKELKMREKLKAYRKEIVLGVTGGILLVGGILLYKKIGLDNVVNYTIENASIHTENSEVTVEEEVMDKIINVFSVNGHIRRLSNGRKASKTQILAALEYGVELAENETWINPYMKGIAS